MQPLNRSRPLSDMGMTPSHQRSARQTPREPHCPGPGRRPRSRCAAIVVFAFSLPRNSFEDEYAYITQSLLRRPVLRGQFNDALWLESPAYDLQPFRRYLIGARFRLANSRCRPVAMAQLVRPLRAVSELRRRSIAARLPIILLGASAVSHLWLRHSRSRTDGSGTIAAILLMLNPLYRLHAHRAMSDVPCEAFMLVGARL